LINNKLARVFRAEYGQVLASLIYFSRDLQLAEDALQDSFEQAHIQWPNKGIPKNPGAWLHVVAKRKLIDKLRQKQSQQEQQKLRLITQYLAIHSSNETENSAENEHDVPDERLRLIFTCCHPALNEAAQVALTLRTLCGLNVGEIARAYLISETTMGQRITRAKKKISSAGIAYEIPNKEQLAYRLTSVLKVIYLIYNESYSAFEGQTLTKQDLANEAIRLGHLMVQLMPCAEVYGLTALMLSHNARRLARQSESEPYIPLDSQNRSLWDKASMQKAEALLTHALTFHQSGSYQIQAAISVLHNQATSWQSTDWPQIVLLYASLYHLNPSPIIALNQAMAKANNGHVQQAYEDIILLFDKLQTYQPYYAARAELEIKLNLVQQALASLGKAIKLTKNTSEQQFLRNKRQLLLI
jgi:RNA polymerase sigma-70 factor (ECF subfamily)